MANYNFPKVTPPIARALREHFGITQEELAKNAGFSSKSTVSKIENGAGNVKKEFIENFFELAQIKVAIDEEEFAELINKFKKNIKLESQILGDEVKINKQIPETEKSDFTMNQILQDALAEKRELIKKNFENMQAMDELRHQFEKFENLQKQRNDFLQERFRELQADFENLKNHEIKNYVNNEYHRIKSEIDDYLVGLFENNDEEKETGLSGLVDKVQNSPIFAPLITSISSKAGDSIGNFIANLLNKVGDNGLFSPIPPGSQENFGSSNHYVPPVSPYSEPFMNQSSQEYNPNDDVSSAYDSSLNDSDRVSKANRKDRQ